MRIDVPTGTTSCMFLLSIRSGAAGRRIPGLLMLPLTPETAAAAAAPTPQNAAGSRGGGPGARMELVQSSAAAAPTLTLEACSTISFITTSEESECIYTPLQVSLSTGLENCPTSSRLY